ncbi:MAG: hypothetical protein VX066_04890, partial [Pseudomonadota bacterium]|nr:hypothetical protein [Pseudomonadota bacterium]
MNSPAFHFPQNTTKHTIYNNIKSQNRHKPGSAQQPDIKVKNPNSGCLSARNYVALSNSPKGKPEEILGYYMENVFLACYKIINILGKLV